MDKFLVEAKILMVDFKPTASNLGVFTTSINQEIEPLKAIVANIKASSEELPDLMEAATGTARSAKQNDGRHQGQSVDPHDCPRQSRAPDHPCLAAHPSLAPGPGSGWWPCWFSAAAPNRTRLGSRCSASMRSRLPGRNHIPQGDLKRASRNFSRALTMSRSVDFLRERRSNSTTWGPWPWRRAIIRRPGTSFPWPTT